MRTHIRKHSTAQLCCCRAIPAALSAHPHPVGCSAHQALSAGPKPHCCCLPLGTVCCVCCCPAPPSLPPTTHSLNEKGLYDYLLLNDDLDATAAELERIAEVRCLGWCMRCLNGCSVLQQQHRGRVERTSAQSMPHSTLAVLNRVRHKPMWASC